MPQSSQVIATGQALGKRVVQNDEFSQWLDTSDEWIRLRTGIHSRHFVKDESTHDLALEASQKALKQSGLQPNDLDMVVLATTTPDKAFPANACALAHHLGMNRHQPAFDVQSVCSGFVYALSVAHHHLLTGQYQRILVVGAERMSQLLDMKDRSSCVLFGDGAGAFILEASDDFGVIDIQLHSQGSFEELLHAPFLDHSQTAHQQGVQSAHLKMKGKEVFKIAVQKLSEMAPKILHKSGFKESDLDWFVPHRANIRIY